MNKLIIIACLCTLFLGPQSFAQSKSPGLKLGLNLSTIGGDAEGVSNRAGFHAGFYFPLEISNKVGAQIETVFSSQGTQSSDIND